MQGGPHERIRAERERRGWSQRQAAGRAGIDHGLWSKVETGKTSISNRVRAGVAKAYDWPLDWPDVAPAEVASVSRLDDLEERVRDLEAFVRSMTRAMLDDRERAAIAQQVVERMASEDAPLRSVETDG